MFWPDHMMGFGWGGWLVGGLFTLLFWGGLIAVVVYSIRAFTSASQNKDEGKTAEDKPLNILKRRYAQGEIDKTEYDAIRHDLET